MSQSYFLRHQGLLALAGMLVLGGCATSPAPDEKTVPAPENIATVPCAPPEKEKPVAAAMAPAAQGKSSLAGLLDDLARYPALKREELRRLQGTLEDGARGSGDDKANRVRLAVLWSLQRSQQGDQKAAALLDQVVKSKEAMVELRNLANALQVQIQERQQVWQKLDALLAVDRKILEDRLPGAKAGKAATSPPSSDKAKNP